jgi:hypothetical protein
MRYRYKYLFDSLFTFTILKYPIEYLPGGFTEKHLNLKALPTGLYYLPIQTATGSVGKKIQIVL